MLNLVFSGGRLRFVFYVGCGVENEFERYRLSVDEVY